MDLHSKLFHFMGHVYTMYYALLSLIIYKLLLFFFVFLYFSI